MEPADMYESCMGDENGRKRDDEAEVSGRAVDGGINLENNALLLKERRTRQLMDGIFIIPVGVFLTIFIGIIGYGNYLLFRPYAGALSWGLIIGVGLRGPKERLVNFLQKAVDKTPPSVSIVQHILKPCWRFVLFCCICFLAASAAVSPAVFTLASTIGLGLAVLLALLHLTDKRIVYIYRRVVTDDTVIIICLFFLMTALAISGFAFMTAMIFQEGVKGALDLSSMYYNLTKVGMDAIQTGELANASVYGDILANDENNHPIDATAGEGVNLTSRLSVLSGIRNAGKKHLGLDVGEYVLEYVGNDGILLLPQLISSLGVFDNQTMSVLDPFISDWKINITASLQGISDAASETIQVEGQNMEAGMIPPVVDADSCNSTQDPVTSKDGTMRRMFETLQVAVSVDLLKDAWSHIQKLDKGMKDKITVVSQSLLTSSRTIIMSFVSSMVLMITKSINVFIRSLIFTSCVFHVAKSKTDPLINLLALLPLESSRRDKLTQNVQQVVNRVILVPIKLSLLKAFSTLAVFTAFDCILMVLSHNNFIESDRRIEYVFIASALSFLFAILPVVPVHIVMLPWSFVMLLQEGTRIAGILLFFTHQLAIISIDDAVLRPLSGDSSFAAYISSFSVVLGVGAFGIQGIVLGPLLVCFALLLYRGASHYQGGFAAARSR